MQTRDFQRNMVRAENVTSTAYGDPERWGATTTVNVGFAAGDSTLPVVYTPQIVRAQVPQLVAVPWFCTVAITCPDAIKSVDALQYAVEFQIGVGQSTTRIIWIGAQNSGTDGNVTVDRIAADGEDVKNNPAAHLTAPICASAIAARVVLAGRTTGMTNKFLPVTVTLQLAPMPGMR